MDKNTTKIKSDNKVEQKVDDQFSIEKELADMKKSLLDEEQGSSEGEVEHLLNAVLNEDAKASKEEKKPAPAKEKKPLTPAQIAAKEKAKAAKAKEKEKMKAAVAKAKEKEKIKQATLKAKEKEKARIALQQQKEKERAAARAAAKKAAEARLAELDAANKPLPKKDEKKVFEDSLPTTINLDNKEALEEAKNGTVLEDVKDLKQPVDPFKSAPKSTTSESLQRLRDQIMAKKDLEQKIMEGNARRLTPTSSPLPSKEINLDLKELEEKNKKLKDQISKAHANMEKKTPSFTPLKNSDILADIKKNDDSIVKELEKDISELEAKVKGLEEIIASQKDAISKAEVAYKKEYEEKASNELASLKLALEKTNEDNKLELERLQSNFDKEKEALTKELDSLKNIPTVDTTKIVNNINKEYEAKIASLNKENTKQVNDKQKEIDELTKENTSLKKDLTKATNNLENTKQQLNDSIASSTQKLTMASDEIALLKRDLEEARERNVKEADINSELEKMRNQLVEQTTSLEKDKKEIELQKSYLELFKKETVEKAERDIKTSKDELKKYKNEVKVQEDLIRAEEQVKYQDLNKEYSDAKKKLAEATKDINKYETRNIDNERKLAASAATIKRLEENVASLKDENDSLNVRLKEAIDSSLNQKEVTPTSDATIEVLRAELSTKEKEIKIANSNRDDYAARNKALESELVALKDEFTVTKANFAIEREAYAKQIALIDEQLEAMIKDVEDSESSITNTAAVIERYRVALENEKNSHLEVEQKLYDDLEAKEEEIKRLQEEVRNTKLNNQMETMTSLIQALSRNGDVNCCRPNYQAPFYRQYKDDYERELNKKDDIISSLQKEIKDDNETFNAKIQSLEDQIKDLNEALIKQQESNIVDSRSQEVEEYKSYIKSHIVVDSLVGFNDIQVLLDAYKNNKKNVTLTYENESEKLNIALKYASVQADQLLIKAKQSVLVDHYNASLSELELKLEAAIEVIKKNEKANLEEPTIDESIPVEEPEEKIIEDTPEVSPIVAPAIMSEDLETSVKGESEVEEPIYDSFDDKAQELEKASNVKTTPVASFNNPNEVSITFSNEYLNKLNSLRRTRKSLEEKKVVENANHETELANNNRLQEDFRNRIDEINRRINQLTVDYKDRKDHTDSARENYEIAKSKLYLELSTREAQLNKVIDDDVRKINLNYKTIIANIDEQLARLDEEERVLKDTYVLKQKKDQARVERQKELEKRFVESKVVRYIDEEERVIESQDEIRARKFYESAFTEKPVETVKEKVDNPYVDETAVDDVALIDKEQEITLPLEETKEEVEIVEENFSKKELELRKMFDKYSAAEKAYARDFSSVSEYKKIKSSSIAYQNEIDDNRERIIDLSKLSKTTSDSLEKANIKKQISDLEVKQENLKDHLEYSKKQMAKYHKDRHVKEYVGLVQKLEQMTKILKKYQAKRDKKNNVR